MDAKTKKQVYEAYQSGTNSLQDLARIYKVDLDDVLNLTGNGHLATVQTSAGDMIDSSEAGPGGRLNGPESTKVPFTTN
jgi:hypothetical protein